MEPVPFIGVVRHRIGVDGEGVTTLAAFHGCPLRCRYCLNSACFGPSEKLPRYTPESLFEKVRIDNLYFLATNGGVCFGGGEPLLYPDFIKSFRGLCGNAWKLTIESSLNVPPKSLDTVFDVVDDFIVDVKDLNPAIYKEYTGCGNDNVVANLQRLIEQKGPEHVIVRVPLIADYNTEEDRKATVDKLRGWGVVRINKFEYIVPSKK